MFAQCDAWLLLKITVMQAMDGPRMAAIARSQVGETHSRVQRLLRSRRELL